MRWRSASTSCSFRMLNSCAQERRRRLRETPTQRTSREGGLRPGRGAAGVAALAGEQAGRARAEVRGEFGLDGSSRSATRRRCESGLACGAVEGRPGGGRAGARCRVPKSLATTAAERVGQHPPAGRAAAGGAPIAHAVADVQCGPLTSARDLRHERRGGAPPRPSR